MGAFVSADAIDATGGLQFRHTFTAEESVVNVEHVVQLRSPKHKVGIAAELLLAVYFGIETGLDCWKFWRHRHGGEDINDALLEDYYQYTDDDDDEYRYSMLQQQADVWINIMAYAYMTYETYHDYYRSKATRRDIQRSLTATLISTAAIPPGTAAGTAPKES